MRNGLPQEKPNFFNRIGQSSVRKPLAWLVTVYILAIVTFYAIFGALAGRDIPEKMASILIWLISIPCAVVGSSSYEAVRLPQRPDPEEGKDGDDDGASCEIPDLRFRV